MAAIEIQATERTQLGKATTALRARGLIPAELYGHGTSNVHLAVTRADFTRAFKRAGESAMVEIVFPLAGSQQRRSAMIHDIARDPLTGDVLAIDFYQVRLDERVRVKVPLEFSAEAPAVKAKLGILVKSVHELEVEALPGSIPRAITVDLAPLDRIGASVHVRDLLVPADVKGFADPQTVVATITETAKEEEVAPVAEAAAVEEVKVEGEEKVKERQAKKETTPAPAGEAKPEKPARQ